jgi:hypothetical protein
MSRRRAKGEMQLMSRTGAAKSRITELSDPKNTPIEYVEKELCDQARIGCEIKGMRASRKAATIVR